MNIRQDIINKAENSIKNQMLRDTKFQRKNLPTGKVFNPTANYRKHHIAAKLNYRKDKYIQDFFSFDDYDDLFCIGDGAFSRVYEYTNDYVISISANNEDGQIKFLVALGLNEYFKKYHKTSYLHAVIITRYDIIMLLTKLENTGLYDNHNYEWNMVENSYNYSSSYYSHIKHQAQIVRSMVELWCKNPYHDTYRKNWGTYKDDIICYDPYWGYIWNTDENSIIDLATSYNVPAIKK